MENKALWQKATQGLYQAILINVFCSIAVVVFGFLATLGELGDMAEAVETGKMSVGWGLWDYLECFANIGVIAAQVLFFLRLGDWMNVAQAPDSKAIGNIRLAMILSIVSILVAFIPGAGWILSLILSLAAIILQLLGYAALKNSTTLPANAKAGAGKVFTSQILAIIGVVVALIPFIGGIAALVCSIIGFILMLKGWKLIANSAE